MIHNMPFFRFPLYPYPRNPARNIYQRNSTPTTYENSNMTSPPTEIGNNGNLSNPRNQIKEEKRSSNYSSIGPILINMDGFSNKDEPLLEFSGLTLYLDDTIILSLLYILYKEDVKDDMLFMLLILLLIT